MLVGKKEGHIFPEVWNFEDERNIMLSVQVQFLLTSILQTTLNFELNKKKEMQWNEGQNYKFHGATLSQDT